MKPIIKIARAELQKLFFSPVAWIILVVFTFQVSMLFTNMLSDVLHAQRMRRELSGLTWMIFSMLNVRNGVFQDLTGYLYLYIPLLTMNIMSREISTGSIKLLYSSPVTSLQIILGKYLALMLYGLVLMVILAVFTVYGICTIQHADVPLLLNALMGIFLLICAYCAIGLFMSSITSYAVVAAMGTLAVLALLEYIKSVGQETAFVRDITYWLAISGRVQTFILGLITTEDLLYFLLVIGMFLGFTIIRLHGGRQKNSRWVMAGRYGSLFVVAMLIGYLSALPRWKGYIDVTRTKSNTLSKSSQAVMQKMDSGLTITTYANMLNTYSWIAEPRAYKGDVRRFEQYVRFKPEIRLRYDYYYRRVPNEYYDKTYPHLSEAALMDTIKLINKWDFAIPPYKDLPDKADLSPEDFRFVRVLERANGKKTFLRVFDDQWVLPFESEITAAMKRLTEDLPRVGFLIGHNERSGNRDGDREYKKFAQERTYRYSLINNGFDFEDLRLDQPVPSTVNILIIAEMKAALTAVQKGNLQSYLDRGGDLLIAGEPGRQSFMNALVEPLGIQFLPGELAGTSAAYQGNLMVCKPTAEAPGFSYHLEEALKKGRVLALPSSTGIEVVQDKGFNIRRLFTTDSLCWNEQQTTNFIDDSVSFDAATEKRGSYTVVQAMSRKVNGREQRILVTGDADWLSNSELGMQRKDIRQISSSLIQGAFYWLSHEEAPIDIRHDPSTDNMLRLTPGGWQVAAILLKWMFPLLLVMASLLIWLRRRGR